jgi:hypothetical protein
VKDLKNIFFPFWKLVFEIIEKKNKARGIENQDDTYLLLSFRSKNFQNLSEIPLTVE